ncbi:MAG: tetratricopeptide repeat protein [Myxococcota bacterium]
MAPRSSARPVEIVYYPKKARPPRRPTVETVVTEITEEPRAQKAARRTLTDETVDPAEQAFSELTRLGHEAFEAGRTEEAKTIFSSLVALGRRDAFAHTMLGTILLASQSLDEALAQFDAALELDPTDLAALVYRGEIRLSKRKLSAARGDLEKAVEVGASGDPFVARAKKLLTMARSNRTS